MSGPALKRNNLVQRGLQRGARLVGDAPELGLHRIADDLAWSNPPRIEQPHAKRNDVDHATGPMRVDGPSDRYAEPTVRVGLAYREGPLGEELGPDDPEERSVELGPGELFVVPAGVEHCPEADVETQVLLIEPKDTVNTGDAGGPMTVTPREI